MDTIVAAIRAAAGSGGAGSNAAEAIIEGDRRQTFPELAAAIKRTAAALVGHGVGPGDRVAIWAPNRLEWILAALGTQYLGAILVPLNTRFKGPEAADILARTGARALFVDQGFLGADYLGMLPERPPVVVTLSEPVPGAETWAEFLAAAERTDPDDVEKLADAVTGETVADILFTSGTTGRAKGAMSAHRQTVGVARAWAERAEVTGEDRYLIVNPFFHSFGSKAGYLVCLLRGATIVPQAVFDAEACLDLIERERITLLPGAPTIYQSLLDSPTLAGRDLSSLRLAVTGAATVPTSLVVRTREELGFRTVLTAYGLTEAVVVTMCTRGDDPETVAHTCGTAIDGLAVRIAESGEVLVRGEHVMLGYLDDPDATAAAIDPEGWLHTGDVGVLDERGYLRITDRIKDMFTVGGFNVYPAEVEHVLSAHPDLLEAAVVGVPDHRLGEVGRAFVRPRRGAIVEEAELIAYCRERLANYKVPRSVVTVAELPRNAAGKVLKTQLRSVISR
jgi:acyl-CoA synthetase (AMP-forming)/AMP-acid ligase II